MLLLHPHHHAAADVPLPPVAVGCLTAAANGNKWRRSGYLQFAACHRLQLAIDRLAGALRKPCLLPDASLFTIPICKLLSLDANLREREGLPSIGKPAQWRDQGTPYPSVAAAGAFQGVLAGAMPMLATPPSTFLKLNKTSKRTPVEPYSRLTHQAHSRSVGPCCKFLYSLS